MTHDELLVEITDTIGWMESESEPERLYTPETYNDLKRRLGIYKALRAVVELQGKDKSLLYTGVKNYADGYNQALADVRQIIEKELG